MLFHKLRKRVNADVQGLGLTGIQSRAIHYILVKALKGPFISATWKAYSA